MAGGQMASASGEKTEKATPRKLKQARREGRSATARSSGRG